MAYVGSNEDVMRIRKHEKQREEQKKKFEAQKNQHAENIDKAGFRQFGTGQSEVTTPHVQHLAQFSHTHTVGRPWQGLSHSLKQAPSQSLVTQLCSSHSSAMVVALQVLEAAFKNETVGLVTREEFINKRQTLADRYEEDAKRKRQESEDKALQVTTRASSGDAKGLSQTTCLSHHHSLPV